MIVNKNIRLSALISWSFNEILGLIVFMTIVAALYYFNIINISIPWLPVSVIGTAVAFYVGFKNNQSYDRMWEARKIWGGIVNESRTWGMMVDGFINNQFQPNPLTDEELYEIKKRLIYRHIAWLYAHRSQLLVPTPWEHVSQTGQVARAARFYQQKFGIGLLDDQTTRTELKQFLSPEEHDRLIAYVNTATQIVNAQSRELSKLREKLIIDDFRHMSMENVLRSFYDLQGKNERIKKFPFPRQYASMSQLFTWIFILLFPFSMIPELMALGNLGFWLSGPISILIGWVYIMMEKVGDYSENPFQGMANDIPMLSLCRTIEIDLRQMLNETKLPPPIEAKNGILM